MALVGLPPSQPFVNIGAYCNMVSAKIREAQMHLAVP